MKARGRKMRGNLSAWALSHQKLVLFLIVASALAGVYAYLNLGRAEDPSFTFKVMTIRTQWPGATAREVELQVTDRIEKTLQELPYFDVAQSYSKPGDSVIFVTLEDSAPASQVPELWYQVRKKIGDMRAQLPVGVLGPDFNDEFGDVYSAIYAFMSDDFTPAEMKKVTEEVRERLLRVPGVEKADLIAPQEEQIAVEISDTRLARFGLPMVTVIDALRRQNNILPAGEADIGSERVFMRVNMGLDTVEHIRSLQFEVSGHLLTLGD